MKKTSTAATESNKKLHGKLTIGLDLGDRWSWYCVLDEAGEVIGEQKLGTSPNATNEVFAAMPPSRGRVGDRGVTVDPPSAERTGT